MTERVQRAAIVTEALSWLATPWHHASRVKGAGVDCGNLVAAVFESAGWPHVEAGEYPADWASHRCEERFLQIVEQHAKRIDGEPLPADIALFRFGRCLSHAAIVVAWPRIIHAYARARAVILDDALANSDLASKFVGAWSPWNREM